MEQLLQSCTLPAAEQLLWQTPGKPGYCFSPQEECVRVLHTSYPEGMGEWDLPFAFFAWLAHGTFYLAKRIRSRPAPCSIEQGYPKERLTFRRAQGLREATKPDRLSTCQQSKTVSVKGSGEGMQQPQVTTYADIAELRTVTGAAACNQLLADGWVLLGVYPLTTVAEMTSGGEQQKQDIQRYVRRFVGYVVGRRRG
jgi:hypothetical protein